MAGEMHSDPLQFMPIAMRRNHEAFEGTTPVLFERCGHGNGGLAGTDHHGAPLWRLRQMRRHGGRRIGRPDRRIENFTQY